MLVKYVAKLNINQWHDPNGFSQTGTPQTLLVGFEGERSNRTSSECTRKRVQARLVRVTTSTMTTTYFD